MRKPNYISKIVDEYIKNPRPGVLFTQVSHDDWCAIFEGGLCNCNPDIETVPMDVAIGDPQ